MSMAPTSCNGDEIMIDHNDGASRLRNGIYVPRMDDVLMVKRVSVGPLRTQFTVGSDNPAYPQWKGIDPDTILIIRRVVWYGRRLQEVYRWAMNSPSSPKIPTDDRGDCRRGHRPDQKEGRDAIVPPATTPVPFGSNAELARALIRLRRQRDRLLGSELFADPAWDMLLDLFVNTDAQRNISASSLCIAAAVPPTTALRHIAVMEKRGIIARRKDPRYDRRVFIVLTPEWHAKVDRLMMSWMSESVQAA